MRRLIAYLVSSVFVVVAVVLLGLATPIGRGMLADFVARTASSDSLTVSIEGLTGWPPFHFGVDKLTLSDREGVFAEIDMLDIDVSVSQLLTGTIAVDAITAARVLVERTPAPTDNASSSGALLPFVAARIAVAELVLGDALVGRKAVLSLDGSASNTTGGAVQLDLQADRTDGIEGRFTAKIDRTSSDSLFAADITVSEAANGILVGLIGRPSGPAYKLAARATPDGEAVRGAVTLASDDDAQFNGGFALAPDGAAKRLQITASGDLAELVPPEFTGLLSGPIDVGLDADWTTTDGSYLPEIAVRQGQLSTATVKASLTGTLSRALADLSFQLDIADPSGSQIALPTATAAELRSVSLRGTVAPSNGIIRADLVGNVAGLKLDRVVLPATGLSLAVETVEGGSIFGGSLPYSLRLEAETIETGSGQIQASAGAPLLLTAQGTIDTASATVDANIDLRAAGGQVNFKGTVSGGEIVGTANAVINELQPLSPIAGRTISGGLNASAEGTFVGSNGSDIKVDAELNDLDPGSEALGRLLSGQTKVTASVATDGEGGVSVSDFSFDGTMIETTGDATVRDGTIEASLVGAIADLSSLADKTAGRATFTADLSGSATRPEVDASVSIAEGELLGQPIADGIARLRGSGSNDAWNGTATLGGSFAGKPLTGKVDVVASSVESQFSFPDIDLTVDDNRISGALERTSNGLLSGALDVEAPNMATLAALALVEMTGSAEARLTFTPDADRQMIAATFSGDSISYQTVAVQSVQGEARVEDAFGIPRVNGSARATAAQIGSTRIDTVAATAATAASEANATAFEMSAKGPDLDLSAAGNLANDAGVSVLRLDTIAGSAFRVPIELQTPVTIRFDDQQAGIPTVRVALGGGSVVVDGSVSPALDLTIAVERIPASVANGFAPNLGAGGIVNGRAAVTGTSSSPSIAWNVNWSALQTAATVKAKLPALELSVSGNATMRATTIDGTVTGAGLSLVVKGDAPLNGEGLNLTVSGSAPLALIALETKRELRLAGNAQLDISIAGSARAPQITGAVNLADATVIDGETGFGVVGATGRIAFNGQSASTDRISGRMAQGGQLTLAGSVDIANSQLPANLTISVSNGRFNDGQVVNALFDANLAVNGPLIGNGRLTGTVALGRTEIQLPDGLSSSATAIDVTHINVPPGFVAPLSEKSQRAAARSPATSSLGLDVEVTNSGGIFVRGFGIDSEFGGSLRVTNTIANVQAVGAFTMRRGRIEVIGRRFELVSGTLTFTGDLVPVVDFAATASTSEAEVTVSVVGPANDPTISFSSVPELPEEEILSQLLFNRNVSSLSVLQVAQLVDAAAQFSGGSNGDGLFSRIRNALGVDDLDIRQNASGGTTVGIGKRINENINLGVEAGTDSQDGRVTIDLDITPNLKAQGSAGQGGSGSIGLTYEREY